MGPTLPARRGPVDGGDQEAAAVLDEEDSEELLEELLELDEDSAELLDELLEDDEPPRLSVL